MPEPTDADDRVDPSNAAEAWARVAELESEVQRLQKKMAASKRASSARQVGKRDYDILAWVPWKFAEEQTKDIAIRLDGEGRVLSCSAALESWSQSEDIGKTRPFFGSFLSTSDRDAIGETLKTLKEGESVKIPNLHLVRKNSMPSHGMSFALVRFGGGFLGWGIPAEKGSERTLDLALAVVHELRQPLTAIYNYALACQRLLVAAPGSSEEVGRNLEQIVRQTQRAEQCLRELRQLSGSGAGPRTWIAMNDVVRETLTLLEAEIAERRLAVDLDLTEQLPPVWANAAQIGLVVLNLTKNAAEAMSSTPPSRRRLRISTAQHDREVRVAIRDSGEGLSLERIQNLFEPYRTTKPGGMGVGLALCRAILDAHGGRIWANSLGAKGTIFTFALNLDSK